MEKILIEYLEGLLKEEKRLSNFNIEQMEKDSEFASYHREQYLINYYRIQLITDILNKVAELSVKE